MTPDSLIGDMVGREVGTSLPRPHRPRDEVILSVRDLECDDVFRGVSFDLHRARCWPLPAHRGTADGCGAVPVRHPAATGGTVCYKGADVRFTRPAEAIAAGIAYVSEDRRKLGLAMPMPIFANMSLATLRNLLSPAGIIDRRREREIAEAYRKRLNIRTPDVDLAVGMLSGGNQQKVMLAKWLEMKPDLLIFDEPTRGIDVGAKAEVHDLIRAFAAQGGAVIVISSDLPEVLAMGDRILVMREGRQTGILPHDGATQESVMRLALGQQEAA